jgi:predicted RNA binding protein YcfA (HicA-like mRNA interferase family)
MENKMKTADKIKALGKLGYKVGKEGKGGHCNVVVGVHPNTCAVSIPIGYINEPSFTVERLAAWLDSEVAERAGSGGAKGAPGMTDEPQVAGVPADDKFGGLLASSVQAELSRLGFNVYRRKSLLGTFMRVEDRRNGCFKDYKELAWPHLTVRLVLADFRLDL